MKKTVTVLQNTISADKLLNGLLCKASYRLNESAMPQERPGLEFVC